jgi:hypothetical protein
MLPKKDKITAILLNWMRQENIRIILENLVHNHLVDEIIIWNNNPSIRLLFMHPKIKIINSPKNYGTFARYSAATLAENETIFFQDDDLLPTEAQIRTLYNAYKKDPTRLYGYFGRNLEVGNYIAEDVFGDVDIIMDGMMIFNKSLLSTFFEAISELGIQPQSKCDIIFSLFLRRKHFAVDLGEIKKLPDPFALSSQKGHFEKRRAMVDLCLRKINFK